MICCCISLFFFFKQKTAYEMRISDWSSDVCSSDLLRTALFSDQSVLKGSFNLQFSLPDEDTAQGVRVTYWDAETGEQKQVMCGDDVNTLEVSLDGCTSRQQAFNEGWFQLKDRKSTRLNSSH